MTKESKIVVYVKTFKKEQKVIQISGSEFEVWVKSKPINNMANKELIDILSKYFNTPKKNIKIISGKTSKKKIINILK